MFEIEIILDVVGYLLMAYFVQIVYEQPFPLIFRQGLISEGLSKRIDVARFPAYCDDGDVYPHLSPPAT